MELMKAPRRSISPFLGGRVLPVVDGVRELEKTGVPPKKWSIV